MIISVGHLLFCHICSRASASSWLVISSESWNLRKPSPPWPVRYISILLPSSVRRRLDLGVSGGTRPVSRRTKFSTETWSYIAITNNHSNIPYIYLWHLQHRGLSSWKKKRKKHSEELFGSWFITLKKKYNNKKRKKKDFFYDLSL